MANGVQLATAYISLNVNTRDIKGQVESAFRQIGSQGHATGIAMGRNIAGGMKGAFGGGSFAGSLFNPIELAGIRWATRAGATIGTALKRSIMGVLGGIGIGSILGLGGILSGGLERLKTLQRAEVQLSLKLPPQEIAKVKDAVQKAVDKTPISLDAAMQSAPRLVNAGLNADEIERYVRAVGDLTASTGGLADFERLDIILSQVRSKTKLTGEELMQLVEAGVDVRGILKQAFSWDDKTLEKMLKNGKIGIDEIITAAQKVLPGLSLKMGETFEGAMKNLTASVRRIGANFISAILGKEANEDPLKDYALGISSITDSLRGVEKFITDNREKIHGFFTRARDIILEVSKAVENVIKFLNDNKTVAMALGGVYAGWKVVSITATVADNLSRALDFADRLNKKKIAPATDALGGGSTTVVGGVTGSGGKAGRFGAVGRLGGKVLRAVPFVGTAAILYDILTEIPLVRDLTDQIPGWFTKAKASISDAFTSDKMKKFFEDAKSSASSFINNLSTSFSQGITRATDTIKSKLENAVDSVKKKWDSIFGENGWFATQFKRLGELVDKVREVLGLGPATANAAGGTTPFNAGPQAPTAATPGGGGLTGRVGAAGVPSSGSLQTQQKNPWTSEWDVLGKGGASKPAAKPSGVIKSAGTPYGLDPLADTGGYGNPAGEKMFPPWVLQLGAKYGVKPSTYPNHQVGSGLNQGIDWVGSVDQMDAFARWLVSTKPPGLKQVIWQNPNTQFRVGSVDNKPVGPDLADTTDPGYYSRGKNDWADHQNHVHTAWSENLDLSQFATGGSVFGAGSATSDSIPAMLSNGEHVLTAADVKAMGGQKGVYAFRAALQKGLIPGFAPGGAVDPNQVQDLNNQLYDLRSAQDLAQKQLDELPEDATAVQRLQAETQLSQATRALQQATADFPIIMSGGTPPDRSLQNNVLDTTDSARLALAQLDDLRQRVASGEDIKPSQIYSAESQANVAQRNRQQAIDALNKPISFIDEFQRTAGFVPTAAGNTGVAGTSALSSVIGMGNEFVGGLIDTGASLLQTAAQAGITAGTMGAGAAAGPASGAAASYGIQLGASVLKRASSFGFQLASIGADSLIAQLFPFGAPRWIGYDYTGFMPQLGIQQAALTTIEKMGNQEIQKRFGQGFDVPPLNPQSPEAPIASPDAPAGPAPIGGMVGPQNPVPDTGNIDLAPWLRNSPGGGGGSWARGGAISIYDQGGVLKPGDLALNASRRPERILTDKQWDALSKIQPVGQQPLVKIDTIYGMSPEDVANQITSKQQLAMMRYAGRP